MDTVIGTAGRKVFIEAACVRVDGSAIDLTQVGVQAWFTVKEATADLDAAIVVQKTEGAGIALNDPSSTPKNLLTVTLDAADTDQYQDAAVDLVYDLVVNDPGTTRGPETLSQGVLKMTPPVLRTPA
jgi:hypothetical protein